MNSPGETHSLRESAAQTRAKAIRTQLSLGLSFIELAKTEIEFGRADQAQLLAGKVRHIADTARKHIHEQGHIPPENVSDSTEQLTRLEALLADLEQKLAS